MACISCGVITRAWLWRNSSRCDKAIASVPDGNWSDSCLAKATPVRPGWRYAIPQCGSAQGNGKCRRRPEIRQGGGGGRLEPEFLAQVEPPHIGIVHDVVRPPLHQHLARIDDVGAVGQA